MAQNSEYIEQFEEMPKDHDKTAEINILIPGIEVKYNIPVVGSKLKDNCTVEPTFNKNSLEIIAVVRKEDGSELRYRYTLQKLPGEIIPEECTYKASDGMVTLILKKAKPVKSWEVQMEKGLRNLT